ncbi:MAG: N-6 DNA methylase [Candidatus Thiodiazotropha sp. (ex Lucinoma kastoroae)]|nr:N-6 DNA methylase [Candidatus Thiodiazotropha sp. (ex Lucinoma kastoroae)]
MKTLSTEFRRQLERTVIEARDVAEAGARVVLEALAVQHHEPYGHMDTEQRTLRRRLRAHARQLGDRLDARLGAHGIDHLVQECAYEHWHGMLFARFLAENYLLIELEMGVAISLDECEELAKEEGLNKWQLAARFAHHMLPQVFRPDHPVFEVQFAREHRLKLEGLVEELPAEVFAATDALGWVYQFWQAKKKDEVNRSEVKIGADELPAVTQLFTEPYMVQFLLHNSLGAWWVSRHPDKQCPIDLTYLRKTDEGAPAAGSFEGWPDDLSEFRLLDPCCGSGHFLVAAFLMLAPVRMALENLSAAEAVDAVLLENLHGLELDQRCVAIAAFALALEAWRYPEAGGYRPLPGLNIAWCGQPVAGKRKQWLELAEGNSRIEAGMAALYDTFHDAPILGSLIDPTRSVSEDMLTAGFAELEPLLEQALREHAGEEEWEEMAIAARRIADAVLWMSRAYDLVITNVPYRSASDLDPRVRRFINSFYELGKTDLATAFLLRCLEYLAPDGMAALVIPQNFLIQPTYKALRKFLLRHNHLSGVARVGPGAFEEISGEVVNVALVFLGKGLLAREKGWAIDSGRERGTENKKEALLTKKLASLDQSVQINNPDHVIVLSGNSNDTQFLGTKAQSVQGIKTGDDERYKRKFWEASELLPGWIEYQSTSSVTRFFGGLEHILYWGSDGKHLARRQGLNAWRKPGVAVSQMSSLPCCIYIGGAFDSNMTAIVPRKASDYVPLLNYAVSGQLSSDVREFDHSIKPTNSSFEKVPFDLAYWRSNGQFRGVSGIPGPYSEDPTQWVFHGHPKSSCSVLQVIVARLVGYHWPAENDPEMELADEARGWIGKTKTLHALEDEDGIVCLPSIRGEPAAHERLLQLLESAWGNDWSTGIHTKLLSDAGVNSLDDWFRNQFFEQHCKLFHNRPFIWNIWDGRKRDGFHALVNYHKLAEGNGKGRKLLESLTYSYLGDWITRQQDGVKRGDGGAEDRLAAALELQKRLVAILEGEPPFDLFVRWKPIEEQPIGWEPDINDGVRLNIRPFMTQDIPGGKKGAGILRAKPNIKWSKDRGKEPMREQEQFPWFWNDGKFTGERINDVHLTSAEKRKARERAEGKQ